MTERPLSVVGHFVTRVDGYDKAYGRTKYTADVSLPETLHVQMLTSPYAHAKINHIDTSRIWDVQGVRAVVTGNDFPIRVGPLVADRMPLAVDKVRYYGEPVALVIANKPHQAKAACNKIKVSYEQLPVINSPQEAMQNESVLIHEQLNDYKLQVEGICAVPNTNIANHTKIRKGDMEKGWKNSDKIVEAEFSFSPSDHAALETRAVRAEILPDGRVMIYTSSQGPFYVKKLLSQFLKIDEGKISVQTSMLGGAFGGKGCVQLEFLAYLASKAVGGKMVRLVNSREQDMVTSPVHIGLHAKVKLGADSAGKLQAASYEFLFDGGAYSDMGAGISKAGAVDCTGPYKIDNVHCDSYCMYTNHPYATSFRGFGHPEQAFAMERTMDMLAKELAMDPLELRMINAIKPGDTTPTQVHLNASNLGDLPSCLRKLKTLTDYKETKSKITKEGKIRTIGISAFWKTSSTPPNATAGVILTFNTDGSINLNCGAVELGQGSKTVLAQILAERLQMDMKKINVTFEVSTEYDPHQWKTVASSTTYLAGRAVLAAADDIIRQLKQIGSVALRCSPDDLNVGQRLIYLKDSPEYNMKIKDVVVAYKYPNGNSVGGLVIGKGSHVVRHLTPLDPHTGFGKPGPQWTVGAQAVETEYDPKTHAYRIIKAATVLDAGKVINPALAIGQMRGGMYLGLSWASRESFSFDEQAIVCNPSFRSYDVMRIQDHPDYLVDFVETPLVDGPYGARGIGEYGVIGMAGALANSLSQASSCNINQLPIIPETIWKLTKGDKQ